MFEKQQERQYDDTLQVQQGVINNSKAMETQAITSGIQGLAGAVDTGVDIWQTEQKQQQAQASNSALNSYGNWLEKEVQMKEQGIDAKVIDAERVKLEQQLMVDGAGRDDLLKLRKQFEGTSLGKSLTEKTPEEKAYEKDAEEAASLNMSVDTLRARQRTLSDFAADTAAGTENAVASMTRYNQVSFDAIKSQTNSIIMDFQNDQDRAVAEQRLRELQANIQREAAGWTSGTDISPAQAEAIIKPNLKYVNYILEDLTAEGFADKSANMLKIVENQNKLQLYQNDPELISYESMSELAKHTPGLQASLAKAYLSTFESIIAGSKEGSPKQLDSMLVTSTPASKEVLNTVEKIVTDPDAPQETKQELSAGVVKGIATQLGENLDLSDSKSTMEFVASEAGKELYKNKDSYPEYDEYVTKVKNHSLSALQKMEARLEEIGSDVSGGQGGGTGNLGMSLTKGGVVVFSGNSPAASRKAARVNKEMSKAATVFVTALANAQGITVQESFDEMFQSSEVFSQYIKSEPRTAMEKVELPAQGGGSAERMGVDLGAGDVTVEKDLGEMTVKRTGNEEFDNELNEIRELIDSGNVDPSYSYVLKRKLARLNDVAGRAVAANNNRQRGRSSVASEPTKSNVNIDNDSALWAEFYNAEHKSSNKPQEKLEEMTEYAKGKYDTEVLPEVKNSAESAFNSGAFDSELDNIGISREEAIRLLTVFSKFETEGGRNNNISTGGAGGYFQVIPSTFVSLISDEGIVGQKALAELGLPKEELLAMSNKEIGEYLRDDSKAAGIFGAAALMSRLMSAKRLGKYSPGDTQ